MISYLARKYFTHVIVLTLGLGALPVLFARLPFRDALLWALFWASFFAAATVYVEFKRHGIWPLYDNLRLPRILLLGILAAINLIIYAGLRIWMMQL